MCISIYWGKYTEYGRIIELEKDQWRHWHSRLRQKVKQDVASNTYSHNILAVDEETVLETDWFVVPLSSSPTSSETAHEREKKKVFLLLFWDFVTNTEKNQCQ